jgi:hypothetical protein
MPLTHYPKTVQNIVMAWVQPPPPDVAPDEGMPDFVGAPFSEINLWKEPIAPGTSVVGYHDAQPFTRFYGSIFSSQPLEVSLSFSNDEVDADGHWITDENISSINYDVEALKQLYDSKKQAQTGKFFVTIFGRFLRGEIKNVGDVPTEKIRVYVRGSVF